MKNNKTLVFNGIYCSQNETYFKIPVNDRRLIVMKTGHSFAYVAEYSQYFCFTETRVDSIVHHLQDMT